MTSKVAPRPSISMVLPLLSGLPMVMNLFYGWAPQIVLDGIAPGDSIAIAGTAALKAMSMGLGGGDG